MKMIQVPVGRDQNKSPQIEDHTIRTGEAMSSWEDSMSETDTTEPRGRVSGKDGRLNITLHDKGNTGYLAKAIGSAARKVIPFKDVEHAEVVPPESSSQPRSPWNPQPLAPDAPG